jgi:hypothetical protein
MNNDQFNKSGNQNMSSGGGNKTQEKENLTHKAGDALERLGEKVTNAGAEKLGKVIYDAGNKIEHMGKNK